jgi:FAD-dependent urate hydroxylase
MTVVAFDLPSREDRVAQLTERVRRELTYLNYPVPREWTRPRVVGDRQVLDVLIIGGGQSGLVAAFALRQERVSNTLIVDRNPAGQEGPWNTYARMPHLRTPKDVTGPDLGIPSLTPRAWYEARFGTEAWDKIATFPRTAWHEYLAWYRETLDVSVRSDTTAEHISPDGDLLAVSIAGPSGHETLHARKIIFATGLDGGRSLRIPQIVADRLPKGKYAHAADAIDFTALRGRRIAILGAGASAFDNAGAALDAGAHTVDLFVRRPKLSNVNPLYWMTFSGVLAYFYELPDLHRWRFGRHLETAGTPPPPASVARCKRFAQFTIRLGEPWAAVKDEAEGFTIETPKARDHFDFVICATGTDQNPRGRPELADIADQIALWRDRFTPPAGEDSEILGSYPYLGPAFEFTERQPGAAPWLRNIHNFSFGAVASMGNVGGAPSLRFAVPRLVGGIVRDLFISDADAYLDDFRNFQTPEPEQVHW